MSSRTHGGAANGRSGFFTPHRIVLLIAAVLTFVFIVGNTRLTRIRLLIPEVTVPLWIPLLCTALIGALCGLFLRHRR